VSLEYEWWGSPSERPPVLLLHDALGSVRAWGDVPRRLAEASERRVYAYSRRGAGGSESLEATELPTDYLELEALEVLPALREALRLPEVVLVGLGEGATVGLVHAGGAASPTRAVAAISPILFAEPTLRASIDALEKQFAAGGHVVSTGSSDPEKTFAAWCRLWRSPARDAWNVDDFLRGVTCPTLLARGDQDEFSAPEQQERASQLLHEAQLVSLAGCRHLPHVEKPGVLVEALSWFLGQLP